MLPWEWHSRIPIYHEVATPGESAKGMVEPMG
jgi:hypothetical protein